MGSGLEKQVLYGAGPQGRRGASMRRPLGPSPWSKSSHTQVEPDLNFIMLMSQNFWQKPKLMNFDQINHVINYQYTIRNQALSEKDHFQSLTHIIVIQKQPQVRDLKIDPQCPLISLWLGTDSSPPWARVSSVFIHLFIQDLCCEDLRMPGPGVGAGVQ